jgi:hypothetical protein
MVCLGMVNHNIGTEADNQSPPRRSVSHAREVVTRNCIIAAQGSVSLIKHGGVDPVISGPGDSLCGHLSYCIASGAWNTK